MRSTETVQEFQFRRRMRALRMSRGMTQAAVAKAVGATRGDYAKMESGERVIRLHHAEAIAGVLDITIDAMLSAEPVSVSHQID